MAQNGACFVTGRVTGAPPPERLVFSVRLPLGDPRTRDLTPQSVGVCVKKVCDKDGKELGEKMIHEKFNSLKVTQMDQ